MAVSPVSAWGFQDCREREELLPANHGRTLPQTDLSTSHTRELPKIPTIHLGKLVAFS
jgi:hypothetical protein